MVTDSIENAAQYYGLGKNIEIALQYLQSQDFEAMASGRHEIEGTACYAIVNSYDTKPREQGKWEAHRGYIDIQYVRRGTESMGYARICDLTQGDYQADNDYLPLEGDGEFIILREGMFMILMPQDGHMPGIALGDPAPVCKVIAKVPVG